MAEYREGARRREAARQAKLDERFQLAWKIARQGTEILRGSRLKELAEKLRECFTAVPVAPNPLSA